MIAAIVPDKVGDASVMLWDIGMLKIKGAIIVNICVYLWIGQAFLKGAFNSLAEPMSENLKISYFIIQIGIVFICLICIFGLLLKKEWGRLCTMMCNIALVIIVMVLPIGISLFVSILSGESFSELFYASRIIPISIASVILLILTYYFSRKSSKKYFKDR